MPLEPGTTLGPYQIAGSLGAGGMGEVHKANDTRLDRTVVIKVLAARVRQRPRTLRPVRARSQGVAALYHPNIAHV